MRRAFTLIEILVTLCLIGLATALVVSNLNLGKNTSDAAAANLTTSFAAIESAFLNYNNDKGKFPTGLDDATFVPSYLFVPSLPKGFDSGYGVKGYLLGKASGGPAGTNGYYICARVTVESPSDPLMNALTGLEGSLSSDKYFHSTSCPATANTAPAVGTFHAVYWITRS